jgi:hypothetical protein
MNGLRLSAFSAGNSENWESGDWLVNCKSPPLAGFSAIAGGQVLTGGPPGWRRSADRAGLRANSLLTGNFTGNFAILGLQTLLLISETAGLQPFFT